MAEFVMPALGADMSAGSLASWLKQPGDHVRRGDVIAGFCEYQSPGFL